MAHDLFTLNLFNCKDDKNASLAIRSAHGFGAAGVHFFGSHLKGFNSIGYGDTSKAFRRIPVTATLGRDVPEIKGGRIIGVELTDDAEDIITFAHPAIASYVFGPENGSIPEDVLAQCDQVIKIPTKICLNLSIAVATVFYDRVLKQKRSLRRSP